LFGGKGNNLHEIFTVVITEWLMNMRWLQPLAVALFVLGICALSAAVCVQLMATAAPALEVINADIELNDCAAGDKLEIVLRLHNNSNRPVRILGVVPC
jgi:hypothetical protein